MKTDDDKKKEDDDKGDDDTTAGISNDILNTIKSITEGTDDDDAGDDAGDDDKKKIDDTGGDDDAGDDEAGDDDAGDEEAGDDEAGDDDAGDDDAGEEDDDVLDNSPIAVLGYDEKKIRELNAIDPELVKDIRALAEEGELGDEEEDDDDLSEGDDSTHIDTTVKVDKGDVITEEQMKVLEKENPAMAAIVKGLSTQVGQLSDALGSVTEAEGKRKAQAVQKENFSNFRKTNKRLDELEKTYPIFGTYKNLPKDENGKPNPRNRSVKARSKMWDMAYAFHGTGKFETFEDALDSAVVLYAGKNGKKTAMREVVKDLNAAKKKFTNRPNRNKTKAKGLKPGSDEYKAKIVHDAMVESNVV